jgi:hypothetical protein
MYFSKVSLSTAEEIEKKIRESFQTLKKDLRKSQESGEIVGAKLETKSLKCVKEKECVNG